MCYIKFKEITMRKNIIKVSAVVVMSTLMVGCMGGGVKLSPEAQAKINASTKYNPASVVVTLKSVDATKEAKYPSASELSTLLKVDIQKYLKSNNLACTTKANCLDLDVNLDYKRVFLVKSNSVGVPEFSQRIDIKDGSKVLYSNSLNGQTLETGFTRNMSIISKVGSSDTNVDDEKSDVDRIAKLIVKDVASFTK